MTPGESPAEVTIRREDDEGIVTLVFDDPAQSANTMRRAHVESLEAMLRELEAERERIAGIILASAKRTFFAGGDLNELLAVEDTGFAANVAQTTDQLRRLETLGPPVVAAIGGSALGGGLEIALAAHHRIAVDDDRVQLGFPEVTLGLLPGGGGVARSVRMLGVSTALSELLLDGRRITPRQALELGIVDALANSPEELIGAAKAWLADAAGTRQPWDRPGYRMPGGSPDEPAMTNALPIITAGLSARYRGSRPPAPEAILAAAVEGARVDFDSAVAVERRYFLSLVTGQVAKNMIGAFFFDLQEVSRATRPGRPAPGLPASLARDDAEAVIAAVLQDPAALETVALHVPAPIEETSVLEVLVGPATADADLQRSYVLARALGRTAIVVAVAGGPLSRRLLDALEAEVGALLAAGLPAASVRQAAGQAGFTGPAWSRIEELTAAGDGTPVAGGPEVDLDECKGRLMAAVAAEAARAREDGTVDSDAAANLASLLGVGFPAWTGGALRLQQATSSP